MISALVILISRYVVYGLKGGDNILSLLLLSYILSIVTDIAIIAALLTPLTN